VWPINDQPSGVLARPSVEGTDILSDVLRAVRLNAALFFLTDATTPWSARVPSGSTLTPVILPGAQHLISYHVVLSGRCWCRGPGGPALRLDAGDVIVIPHGDPYALSHPVDAACAWPSEEVVEFFHLMAKHELPFVVEEGGGGSDQVQVLCGFLGCDVRPFNPILSALPRVLRVPRVPDTHDRLDSLIEFAMAERREQRAGSDSVLLRIAELMFVEVVRRHLESLAPEQTGWLAGLRDPIVARALSLLHRQPARAWTLQMLADESAVSRSALAERFAHLVGVPPMHYLKQWRMQNAARMLRDGDAKIAAVAAAVGYESEAAFSRAFARMVGASPASWRKRR